MPPRDWASSTLGERIQHLAEMHGVTLNALGRKAGIASGPMSRLSREGKAMGRAPKTLAQLADAWGVSHQWLAFGVGQPERPREVVYDERYPNRGIAAQIARSGGVPEEAIESVLSEAHKMSEDPPVLAWIDIIRGRAEALRRSAKLAGPELTEEPDELPPRRRPTVAPGSRPRAERSTPPPAPRSRPRRSS